MEKRQHRSVVPEPASGPATGPPTGPATGPPTRRVPGPENDDSSLGPSRRTVLSSERTWLAWWRTGIAVSATALAVGALIPRLLDSSRTPFVLLGAGYALLAIAVFWGAFRRHAEIARALAGDGDVAVGMRWIYGLTIAGVLLALGTFAAMVFAE